MFVCGFNPLVSSDDGEGLGVTKNPLEEVTAGLLDSNGQTLPLQAVHVRCKLMDLLSQVKYYTLTITQYRFPLQSLMSSLFQRNTTLGYFLAVNIL